MINLHIMGILGLNKFIESKKIYNVYDSLCDYEKKIVHKTIGIDFNFFAYKSKYKYGNVLTGIIILTFKLLKNNLKPLFVIDGSIIEEKLNTIYKRTIKKNKIRNTISDIESEILKCTDQLLIKEMEYRKKKLEKRILYITKNDILLCKQFFDILNVNYIHSKIETDIECSFLYKNNIIDACLTNDTDLLLFGCKKIIKLYNNKIIEFNIDDILNKLNITYEQFFELCMCFGCDYNKINIDTILLSYTNNNKIKLSDRREIIYNIIKERRTILNENDLKKMKHIYDLNNYEPTFSKLLFKNGLNKKTLLDFIKKNCYNCFRYVLNNIVKY